MCVMVPSLMMISWATWIANGNSITKKLALTDQNKFEKGAYMSFFREAMNETDSHGRHLAPAKRANFGYLLRKAPQQIAGMNMSH